MPLDEAALQRLRAQRPRTLLFLVLATGMLVGGILLTLRSWHGWQRWPHQTATVVRLDSNLSWHGRSYFPIVRLQTSGGAAVEVPGKTGENQPAIGTAVELAVNPQDPADNISLQAAQVTVALPLLGLFLVAFSVWMLLKLRAAERGGR